MAQTGPAVSELNGQIDYAGGMMDSYEGNNVDAGITVPVTHALGFQADGLYSHIGDGDFYGGAGHFFWRDPDVGLVGLAGGYLHRDGVDTFQLGTEGQYYLGRFTFGVFAGVGQINYANPAPFIDTDPRGLSGPFRLIIIRWTTCGRGFPTLRRLATIWARWNWNIKPRFEAWR
jgi:hypothetical protein